MKNQLENTELNRHRIETEFNLGNNWQISEKNVEAQEISFARTDEKFKQGLIDSYGYFAAKNNLLSAQTDLLQAKYSFHYAYLLLNW